MGRRTLPVLTAFTPKPLLSGFSRKPRSGNADRRRRLCPVAVGRHLSGEGENLESFDNRREAVYCVVTANSQGRIEAQRREADVGKSSRKEVAFGMGAVYAAAHLPQVTAA